MERRRLALPELLIIGGGIAVIVGSFLKWYDPTATRTFIASNRLAQIGIESRNAFQRGLIPIALIPAVVGLLLATRLVLDAFVDVRMPEIIVGMNWKTLGRVLAVGALVVVFGYLLTSRVVAEGQTRAVGVGNIHYDLAIGFWITLAGTIVLAVGAFLPAQGATTSSAPESPSA